MRQVNSLLDRSDEGSSHLWKREGRRLGRQEGEQAIVLRQLERRLGPLPTTQRRQITGLTVPRLEALADALLDFASVDDLKRWLQEATL